MLGAAAMPGAALAAPSATCTEADTGGLDISGTLPSTITITRTPAAGETFFATLQGGVTNSLLIVNGTTLFSGQTTGTRSFKGTGAPITIVYDIQGTGAMRFSCEEAPDPDPDPPDPDPDPSPDPGSTPPEDLTALLGDYNSPLTLLSGPNLTGLPGTPIANMLHFELDPVCPPPTARDDRIAELKRSVNELYEDRFDAGTDVGNAADDVAFEEAEVLRAGFGSDPAAVTTAADNLVSAELRLREKRQRYRDVDAALVQATLELENLSRCTPAGGSGSPMVSQYFAAPNAFAANSPVAAFAPFSESGGIGGTTMLAEEADFRAFASGNASFFGGSGQVAGARGAISIGAARRLDDTTAVGGQIGLSAGRTRLGSMNTTGDFAGISALVASSHRLAESARLDLGLAGGLALNRIDISGATGTYASGQVAAFASLSGEHQVGAFTLTPSGTLAVSHLATAAYTLSDGTAVATTGTSSLDGHAGLRTSQPMALLERDLILEPFVEPQVGFGLSLPNTGTGGPWGGLTFGLGGTHLDGMSFNASGNVAIRGSGFSYGASAGVGGTF